MIFCTMFDWNWPTGSGEDFLNMVFYIVVTSDPRDYNFEKLESTLFQETFM
jgi:hypothetical protein